ncbi:GntR family transcriptional regulator [Streptomyces sp. NPDC004539]|uniref:GntR family transcriptional regulator n=1 Tax=Streptomyces sp. NPDC004539 TaxID=3154280 RepID=UPI0033A89C6D
MVANRYTHIANQLRVQIEQRVLSADDRMPSEADLMAAYSASRPTVRLAMEVLENEGLIVRRHGSGTFVRQPTTRIRYTNDKLSPETRAAIAPVMEVSVTHKTITADNKLCALLGIPTDTRLTEYVYRSRHGTVPYSLAHVYVPAGLLAPDESLKALSPLGDDVRAQLIASGVRLAATQSNITARLPTAEEARLLGIGIGTAVLDIVRTSLDPTGRVVEATLLVLPGFNAEATFTTHSLLREQELEATTR